MRRPGRAGTTVSSEMCMPNHTGDGMTMRDGKILTCMAGASIAGAWAWYA